MKLEAGQKHSNPMGTLHGGVIADLADAAMGMAYYSTLEPGESFATLELKVNFLRPFWTGTLIARGWVVHRGRTVGMTECDVVDERDRLIAKATGTCMYVFGAVDHAAAVARVGRFLGYHVTVCDARARFVTPERFPEVDELVVDWPDRFLARSPVDERTAIVVLTHEHKFDVPALKVALGTNAGYIGAMGSKRTTAVREERLRAEGVTDEQLARVHAPIGLSINARSPEEVAVAIAGEIVAVKRRSAVRSRPPEVFAKTG